MVTALSDPCVECERLPVKSRRNTVCGACGACVCVRCQYTHFVMRHEDEEEMREAGIIA